MVNDSKRKLVQSSLDWTMSQERVFIENLLCQRFNFLLILFSLIIAGSINAKSQTNMTIILGVGTLIFSLVGLTVYRVHIKHDWIMKELYQTEGHPVKICNDAIKKLPWWQRLFSVSKLIGIIIPVVCSLVLLVGTILSILGKLRFN